MKYLFYCDCEYGYSLWLFYYLESSKSRFISLAIFKCCNSSFSRMQKEKTRNKKQKKRAAKNNKWKKNVLYSYFIWHIKWYSYVLCLILLALRAKTEQKKYGDIANESKNKRKMTEYVEHLQIFRISNENISIVHEYRRLLLLVCVRVMCMENVCSL